MKSFIKNINFSNFIFKKNTNNLNLVLKLNTVHRPFSYIQNSTIGNKLNLENQNESIPLSNKPSDKAKKPGKSKTVKNVSSKKTPKIPLEEIMDEEDTEVPKVNKTVASKKGKKGKKGAKAKAQPVEEGENIKENIREKKTKKVEATIISKETDISLLELKDLVIENIVLGNQNGSLPITYLLNCDKKAENPYDKYILTTSYLTQQIISNERQSSCYNYAPIPVVLKQGNGIYVQDVDKNIYVDFLSGYSSLNFGHCNKEILNPVIPQMSTLHMTSRAFYNEPLNQVCNLLKALFQQEKVLFMNSGVEAGESSVKFARKWGYKVKGIPENKAEIIFMNGNFWGRSIAACGSSDDKMRYENFGPFGGLGFSLIDYNNTTKLEEVLKDNSNICGVMLEPIQGENGVIIPDNGYLAKVRELCTKYNVLMIVDEVQTAFGRGAGNVSMCKSQNVIPDMITLGKSLSGGYYPVSAVLGKNSIMDLIRPGEHGSTYGGNPLAMKFVLSTIDYFTKDPSLMKNVDIKEGLMSTYLRFENKLIKEIRGRGMIFAIEMNNDSPVSAYDVCLYLMERGILCKPTKSNIIRYINNFI